MTMLNKKTLSLEELNGVVGGSAAGPVNKTGPLNYPYLQKGESLTLPNTCDPPFKKTGPLGIRV